MSGFEYEIVGDEIADLLPDTYRKNSFGRWPMLIDLARLLAVRDRLNAGVDRVIWLDADTMIFAPLRFQPPINGDHAVGREVWVEPNRKGGWRAHRHVHNAALLFGRGAPALDFLIFATMRVVERLEGPASPQIAGPKLLSALHNLVAFRVWESAGMLSPFVLTDLATGDGPALRAQTRRLEEPIAAANLCHSLWESEIEGLKLDEMVLSSAIETLRSRYEKTGITPN